MGELIFLKIKKKLKFVNFKYIKNAITCSEEKKKTKESFLLD